MTHKAPLVKKHLMSTLAIAVISSHSTLTFARGSDSPIQFLGGSLTLDYLHAKYDDESSTPGQEHKDDEVGQSLMLDFGFVGFGFAGETTINATADSSLSAFKEAKYGDRVYRDDRKNAGKHIEIYNFSAERLGDNADVKLFYHVPRYHWHYEGDYFGLMQEATSIEDSDDFNDKAPIGVELIGKRQFDGLKIVGGKEIYWGADPLTIVKYQFGENKQYTAMALSDVSNKVEQKKFSFQTEMPFGEKGNLRIGILKAGQEKVGETYNYFKNGTVYQKEISSADTYAIKAKVSEEFSPRMSLYTQLSYAGLVAEQGEAYQEVWDTNLPFSSKGNQRTIEIGGQFRNGDYMVWPRLFARDNLIDALPTSAEEFSSGVFRRDLENRADAPFIVNDNRETHAAEIFLTFDPTPGTFFYEWDNAWKEDAKLAYNLGVTYVDYRTKVDQAVVVCDNGSGPFECSLPARPAETMTKVTGRLVANINPDVRLNLEVAAGDQLPVDGSKRNTFNSFKSSVTYKGLNQFGFNYMTDVYGEEDYYKDFGTIFPEVIELSYERRLDESDRPSTVKVEFLRRELNANSGGDWASGANEYMNEARVAFKKTF